MKPAYKIIGTGGEIGVESSVCWVHGMDRSIGVISTEFEERKDSVKLYFIDNIGNRDYWSYDYRWLIKGFVDDDGNFVSMNDEGNMKMKAIALKNMGDNGGVKIGSKLNVFAKSGGISNPVLVSLPPTLEEESKVFKVSSKYIFIYKQEDEPFLKLNKRTFLKPLSEIARILEEDGCICWSEGFYKDGELVFPFDMLDFQEVDLSSKILKYKKILEKLVDITITPTIDKPISYYHNKLIVFMKIKALLTLDCYFTGDDDMMIKNWSETQAEYVWKKILESYIKEKGEDGNNIRFFTSIFCPFCIWMEKYSDGRCSSCPYRIGHRVCGDDLSDYEKVKRFYYENQLIVNPHLIQFFEKEMKNVKTI